MYDPCAQCPCIAHQGTCRKFCAKYKRAVACDAARGLNEISIHNHFKWMKEEMKLKA